MPGASPTTSDALEVRSDASGVFAAFYAQREKRPDDVFLRYGDNSWTWADAASQAHALACSFQDLGIEKGDRVAVTLPNWPEFVLTVLAAAEIGAVVVPLNPAYSARDLQFVLRNTEAALVVTAERYGGTDYLELFESLFSELPGLQYLVTVGEEDLWYDDRIFQFEDLVSAGRGHALIPADIDPTDPFAVLFTAGTSTKHKGVVLSHESLLRTARATAAGLGMTESDRTLCTVPLFNIFGLGVALLTSIVTGSGLVLQESFNVAGGPGSDGSRATDGPARCPDHVRAAAAGRGQPDRGSILPAHRYHRRSTRDSRAGGRCGTRSFRISRSPTGSPKPLRPCP